MMHEVEGEVRGSVREVGGEVMSWLRATHMNWLNYAMCSMTWWQSVVHLPMKTQYARYHRDMHTSQAIVISKSGMHTEMWDVHLAHFLSAQASFRFPPPSFMVRTRILLHIRSERAWCDKEQRMREVPGTPQAPPHLCS